MNVHIRYWHWQPVSFKLNEQWAPAPKHLGMCQMWCYRYAFLFFFRRVWVNRFCILFFSSPFSVLFLNAIVAAAAVFSLRIILFAYASDVDVQCGVVWCNAIYPRKKRTMVKLKIHCSYWRWVSEVMEGVRKYESKRERERVVDFARLTGCSIAQMQIDTYVLLNAVKCSWAPRSLCKHFPISN